MLGSSLIKIHVENAANMNPDFWYANYHHSHPILIERLRNLKYEKPSNAADNVASETSEQASINND